MFQQNKNLQQASNFQIQSLCLCTKGEKDQVGIPFNKCIFLSDGTDGEFGYRLWDPENRKLIRSSDEVFNEDSILSQNQQKIVGKKVSFEIATDGVESK